ncbi:MAG: FG-GAP-like repeat-containing protein [Desulfococcaceae bacterium]|nr:FG-GAP-like repeat-containing protein [Desulfococcaceae bacterium]
MKISKISVKCCTVLFFVFLLSVLTCYPQVWAVEVPFSGKITIGAGFDGAESVFAADVDGDGDMDVLGAAYDADEIAWWENIAGDASTWIKHSIDNMFDGAKSVSAADLDNDGDMDILGAAYLGDKVAWWENTVGDGSQWIIHIIDSDFGRAESVL